MIIISYRCSNTDAYKFDFCGNICCPFYEFFCEKEGIVIMEVMILLISVSLFIALGFLVAFLWAVKNGQYEDKYTPSVRILFDDPEDDPKNLK